MAVTSTPFIPRPLLMAAAAMVLVSMALVAGTRLAGISPAVVLDDAPPTVWRHLHFADRADGAVVVSDAKSGLTLEVLQGEQGFVRGTLRGLAQERLRRGLGPAQPFELQVTGAGRLVLHDPATARRIDLDSFGRDNALIFARWAVPGAVGPRSTAP
jgi:putative photosynthetic complex assembly protein